MTFDFREWEIKASAIEGAARQVPFVLAYALTKSMQDAREAEQAEMVSVFDRPTRYTLNSIQVVPATKRLLTAEIRFKEFPRPAWKWLGPEVAGGSRKHKAFERALLIRGLMQVGEFAVPGRGVRLDASGNIPGSTIVQILSQLGALEYKSGYTANMTAKSKARATKKARGQFFVSGGTTAPRGIYKRVGHKAVPIILFVRGVSYEKRLPYYETARRVVPAAFRRHFAAGWQRFVVDDIRRAVRRAA
ncbi:hypothetical protein CH341_16930 [Rhodoplanes roseus]|uniref:Uncharacterized protein n=1 Tax=Rhodoplanes roseus TaxID=29409 RepID=A0A327L5L1_9BRAD|nr:hypothetical protein CH341_16930 [Rhodoplanes roseus]